MYFILQPYQPLQSPGYQSPEAQAWNRLVAEGIAHGKNSVGDI